MSRKRLSDDEVKSLMNQTRRELYLQDPEPVLQALGLEYKRMGNDSCRMNIRGEKTPSAFISLKHGEWKYKDFGNGSSGTIENVVMDATGISYKEALNYSLQHLGVKNYLEEALQLNNTQVTLSNEHKQRIKDLKKRNLQREASHAVSRVTSIKDVKDYPPAVEYLESRGIKDIPPHIKLITGEYKNRQGEVKRAFGVGVETLNKGADIHFLKQIGDLKSMSFGEKEISYFKNPNSNKVAVFESKMDYAAAYQQINIDAANVIIANSTSNYKQIADILKRENFQTVHFFNQNDRAGYEFVVNVTENANIKKFGCINYNVMSEYKKDINDLLLEDIKIKERFKTADLESFKSIANSLKSIEEAQKQIQSNSRDIREDLKMADRSHTIGQSQSRGL